MNRLSRDPKMITTEKSKSRCGRMTFAVLFGCVVFSVFVSLVYIHEVDKIQSTSRPVKRLVSRRTVLKSPEVDSGKSVNRYIFNDDRPGAKKKPLLKDVVRKIDQFKRRLFPTSATISNAAELNHKTRQKTSSTLNSVQRQAYQSHLDSIQFRSNDKNPYSQFEFQDDFRDKKIDTPVEDSRNVDENHALDSQGKISLVEFPKFQFQDDVDNSNNDLWYPQWIRNQAQFSSNATRYMISHHKTFLNHIYAEAALENVNEETYNVSYSNLGPPDHSYTSKELRCEMNRRLRFCHVNVSTFQRFQPFDTGFVGPILPTDDRLPSRRHFRSCAVVTSSGALAAGRHGAEIDSHDAVFRFNAAPTSGFETVVGGKTTFRILNSQVLAYPEQHDFLGDPLYRQENLTLIIWDPGNFILDMKSWFAKPDHEFLMPYLSFRRLNPKVPAYIVHPRWIWDQWKFIQRHGVPLERWLWGKPMERIYPNPPTSGFMGIVLAMELCDQVTAYEFVPSVNYTEACHYWDDEHMNRFCTLSTWHPASWEKRLMTRLHVGSEKDIYINGKLMIDGYSQCG